MDGDIADVRKLHSLADEFDAALIVDEAHASGVFGARGGGILECSGITGAVWPDNVVKLGTLSKAIGCIGGFVAATPTCIEYLVNRCRSYLFSTAQPPAVAAVAARAVQLCISMDQQRSVLHRSSATLRAKLAELTDRHSCFEASVASMPDQVRAGNLDPAMCPIVPFVVGNDTRAVRLSESLLAKGMYVPAIRPPTVPEGTARLRISLSTGHTVDDLNALVEALDQALAEKSL
jgi:8-amino-7-oxononanoate synthase